MKGWLRMLEYRVETCRVKQMEGIMNALAAEGWRVAAVTALESIGFSIIITFEREKG